MEWKLFFECTRQQGAAEGAADEGVGFRHFEFFWSCCPFAQQKSQCITLEKTAKKKSKPAQMKQNKYTNKPDFKLMTEDIAGRPQFVKFKTKRNVNPLNPVYKVESV